ncbi:MAG: hypothetical protein IJJ47_08610 [Methanosphaera sp.]|nr:hypothetical protein [Methanosphaera sp.]
MILNYNSTITETTIKMKFNMLASDDFQSIITENLNIINRCFLNTIVFQDKNTEYLKDNEFIIKSEQTYIFEINEEIQILLKNGMIILEIDNDSARDENNRIYPYMIIIQEILEILRIKNVYDMTVKFLNVYSTNKNKSNSSIYFKNDNILLKNWNNKLKLSNNLNSTLQYKIISINKDSEKIFIERCASFNKVIPTKQIDIFFNELYDFLFKY